MECLHVARRIAVILVVTLGMLSTGEGRVAAADSGAAAGSAAGAQQEEFLAARAQGDDEGDEGETKTRAKPRRRSRDERYIEKNIEEYLGPTSVKFHDDGRVTMTFDFQKKKEKHQTIFTHKFGSTMKDPMRWTVWEEEAVIGGMPGLRISNSGIALINAWFVDDVDVQMDMLQHINHKPSHIAAVVFCTDKGKIIGSNYGGQCAYFSKKGRPIKRAGKPLAIRFNQLGNIRLVVKDGVFRAYRRNRKKAELKYKRKIFNSGRVGILWGGSIAGTVTGFRVTGRLDTKKMAKKMREYFGDD